MLSSELNRSTKMRIIVISFCFLSALLSAAISHHLLGREKAAALYHRAHGDFERIFTREAGSEDFRKAVIEHHMALDRLYRARSTARLFSGGSAILTIFGILAFVLLPKQEKPNQLPPRLSVGASKSNIYSVVLVSPFLIALGYLGVPLIKERMGFSKPVSEIDVHGPIRVMNSGREQGLVMFKDLEYVKFSLHRAFHEYIEITAFPHQPYQLDSSAFLQIDRKFHDGESREQHERTEVEISIEEFLELESFMTRQDVFEVSYIGTDMATTDGSWWVLEGKKKDLVIQHRRRNPLNSSYPEPVIVAIGLRFLELAKIRIPKDEIY